MGQEVSQNCSASTVFIVILRALEQLRLGADLEFENM